MKQIIVPATDGNGYLFDEPVYCAATAIKEAWFQAEVRISDEARAKAEAETKDNPMIDVDDLCEEVRQGYQEAYDEHLGDMRLKLMDQGFAHTYSVQDETMITITPSGTLVEHWFMDKDEQGREWRRIRWTVLN